MSNPIRILLVEDDGDDVDLLKEALTENNVAYDMDVIKDGGLVAGYIDKCATYPHIIILDFNLPKVHGRELLKLFKSSANFSAIPVAILTTSNAQSDMDYAYREGAAKFLIKPTTVQGINAIVAEIIALV